MAANSPAPASASKPKNSPHDIVRVYNKTRGGFVHGEFSIGAHEHAEVPRKVADLWMSHRSFGEAAVVLSSDVPVSRAGEVHGLRDANKQLEGANDELSQRIIGLEKLIETARGAFSAEEAKSHPAVLILQKELESIRASRK